MEIRPLSEIQIQGGAWSKVWAALPLLRRCFFHIPNEATYDNSQQKSSGVIPGIQDMFLLCDGRAWPIELKDDKGVISREQKVVHAIHKVQGFDTYVFREVDLIVDFITDIYNSKGDFLKLANIYSKWRPYISPYSVAEDYERLLQELQDWKKSQRAKKIK